jgi:hypothetical protein
MCAMTNTGLELSSGVVDDGSAKRAAPSACAKYYAVVLNAVAVRSSAVVNP